MVHKIFSFLRESFNKNIILDSGTREVKGLSISNLQVVYLYEIIQYITYNFKTPLLMLVSFHLVAVSVFLVEIASVHYKNYAPKKKVKKHGAVRVIALI